MKRLRFEKDKIVNMAKAKGTTVKAMAKKLGIKEMTLYSRLKTQYAFPAKDQKAICDFLGVEVREIFEEYEDDEIPPGMLMKAKLLAELAQAQAERKARDKALQSFERQKAYIYADMERMRKLRNIEKENKND